MNKNIFLSFIFLFLGGLTLITTAFFLPSYANKFLTATVYTPPQCPFHIGFTPNQVATDSELSLKQEFILLRLFFTQAMIDKRGVAICKETDSSNTCLARFQDFCYRQGKCTEQYDGSKDATITSEIQSYLCSLWNQLFTKLFTPTSWAKLTSLFNQGNTPVPSWLTTSRNSFLSFNESKTINKNKTINKKPLGITEGGLTGGSKGGNTGGVTGGTGGGQTNTNVSPSSSVLNLLGKYVDFSHPRLNLDSTIMEIYTGDTNLKSGTLYCNGKQMGYGWNATQLPFLNIQNMNLENKNPESKCELKLISSNGQTISYKFQLKDLYKKGETYTGYNAKSVKDDGNSFLHNFNIITSNIKQDGTIILDFKVGASENTNHISRIEIFDAKNKLVDTITWEEAWGWNKTITKILPKGVYNIKVYSGSTLVQSKNIGLDENDKLVNQNQVLSAVGWGSAFDPKWSGSGSCKNNNCNFNLNIKAKGGTRFALIDENGNLIFSSSISSTGELNLNLSKYIGKNQTFYFVVYTTDATNGNETIASIQKGTTNDQGFVDGNTFQDFNYKFGYGPCGGGYLSLPLTFRRNGTATLTDSLGKSVKFNETGMVFIRDLKEGETYTFSVIVDGETMTYPIKFNGWNADGTPNVEYGPPNIVKAGENLKVCTYVCVSSSLCDQSASGYYCTNGRICCEKTHSVFDKDCPGQFGSDYTCHKPEDCKGGSGVGYKCPNGQVCCKVGNVSLSGDNKKTCENDSACGPCEKCDPEQKTCVNLNCSSNQICRNHSCVTTCRSSEDCGECEKCDFTYGNGSTTHNWTFLFANLFSFRKAPIISLEARGICVPVNCESGQVCDQNHGCKDASIKTCEDSSTCEPCEKCENKTCVPVNCERGQVCDHNHGCWDASIKHCEDNSGCDFCEKCVDKICVDVNCGFGQACDYNHGCSSYKYVCSGAPHYNCDPVINAKTGYETVVDCEKVCKQPERITETKECTYKACNDDGTCTWHSKTIQNDESCPPLYGCYSNSDCSQSIQNECTKYEYQVRDDDGNLLYDNNGNPLKGEKTCPEYKKCIGQKCVDNCSGIVCPRGTSCQPTQTGHKCVSGGDANQL